MPKKNYFDFSLFDEVGDAMDLFANTIRNAFEYDSIDGKYEFDAVVLTEPVPMNPAQIETFLAEKPTIPDSNEVGVFGTLNAVRALINNSDEIPKFTFKARAIGSHSPHVFLPDLCDIEVVKTLSQQQRIQDVIDMHTTVIATGANEKPKKGDIVRIRFEPGTFKLNTQTAQFVSLRSSESKAISNILASQAKECSDSALDSFSKYAGKTLGTDPSKIRTNFPNICSHYTEYEDTAFEIGIPPEVMAAFVSVESGGSATAIRFEPHLFNKSSSTKMPFTDNGAGFSSVASETNKSAFDEAYRIDKKLAIESTSWGKVQVLGGHLLSIFSNNPDDAVVGFYAQPEEISKQLVISWFKSRAAAVEAANNDDFETLARLYNGTQYAANAYDVNLKNATEAAKKCSSGVS